MNTPPVPRGRPDEQDDPTGMRALLAGLGDPGPMPADLVDRINASIAAEQQARSAPSADTVVPFRRRRTWSRIGLAAAAVAVVAVGVPTLLGTGPGAVVASLSGGSSNNAASDSAAGSAAPLRSEAKSADGSHRAPSSAGAVRLASSGTAYTASGLATQARAVVDRSAAFAAPKDAPSGSPATSEAGLRACLTALGVAGWMPVTGDVGTYDGRPAVVAVVASDTVQEVYAVDPACDQAHPVLIAGPVPLG